MMTTDYVSRQAVLALRQTPGAYGMDIDSRDVEKLQAENVRPAVCGTWTERYNEEWDLFMRRRWYCSVCNGWNTYGKSRFCPNCGAKMKKQEDT